MPDTGNNRAREIEIELFKRLDTRLERLEEKIDDMNEKIIRLDAQDVTPKLKELETRVRALEEWKSRVMGQVTVIVVPVAAAIGALVKVIFDVLGK